MNKTYLIFKHEFLQTIKRLSWIIMTLIVPVLGLLGIGIFALITNSSKPQEVVIHSIGYVDETGIFTDHTNQGFINLIPYESEESAVQAMLKGEVKEYLIIPNDYKSSGRILRYTFEKELITPPVTSATIKKFLTTNLLEDKVPADIVNLVISPLDIKVTRINEMGDIALEQNNLGNLIISGVFSLLLGLSLMFGATSLVSGLGEEKESRLIEVLFSSVSIRQLLIAKVLALGTAGLLQVLVWLLSVPLLLNIASSSIGGSISSVHIPINFIVLGIVYFILGYLLFAVLSIGIGAISSNAREGGQLSSIYTLTSFIPLWFSSLFIAFPNSAIWVVLTIFPVTAPVQTMLRLGMSDIPMWQIFTSIGVLILTIIGGLFHSIKIFRVNMLMHGKRPGLKDLIYSIKNA
ncbi:MAG: ABC transporter permease [Bacteroidales bacterium]|nr:ABC transporter permease [Bacteroidales bacterium]